MILPDVNVLVCAFRADAEQHARYAAWLREIVSTGASLALCDHVLAGFIRIVTHPRIADPPAPLTDVLAFVEWLIAAPAARWIGSGGATWRAFASFAGDPALRGNLVPDAYLAALCIAQGARLATADRGFARYPGLDWFDPAAGTRA